MEIIAGANRQQTHKLKITQIRSIDVKRVADCYQAHLRVPKEGLYILHKLGGYGNDLFLQVVAMKSNTEATSCPHRDDSNCICLAVVSHAI